MCNSLTLLLPLVLPHLITGFTYTRFSEDLRRRYTLWSYSEAFHTAQAFCEEQGENLASLHNQEDHDLVTAVAREANEDQIWIGAFKSQESATTDHLTWTDGTDMDFIGPGWFGDPEQTCIRLQQDSSDVGSNYTWQNANCAAQFAFVCKKETGCFQKFPGVVLELSESGSLTWNSSEVEPTTSLLGATCFWTIVAPEFMVIRYSFSSLVSPAPNNVSIEPWGENPFRWILGLDGEDTYTGPAYYNSETRFPNEGFGLTSTSFEPFMVIVADMANSDVVAFNVEFEVADPECTAFGFNSNSGLERAEYLTEDQFEFEYPSRADKYSPFHWCFNVFIIPEGKVMRARLTEMHFNLYGAMLLASDTGDELYMNATYDSISESGNIGEFLIADYAYAMSMAFSRAGDGWAMEWDLYDDACLACLMTGGDCVDEDGDDIQDLCRCPSGTCNSGNTLESGCDLTEECDGRQGGWSSWMEWSCCDTQNRTKSRGRLCNDPTPIGNSTYDCPGPDEEEKACDSPPYCSSDVCAQELPGQPIYVNESGSLTWSSLDRDLGPHTLCFWSIIAPDHKVIRYSFSSLVSPAPNIVSLFPALTYEGGLPFAPFGFGHGPAYYNSETRFPNEGMGVTSKTFTPILLIVADLVNNQTVAFDVEFEVEDWECLALRKSGNNESIMEMGSLSYEFVYANLASEIDYPTNSDKYSPYHFCAKMLIAPPGKIIRARLTEAHINIVGGMYAISDTGDRFTVNATHDEVNESGNLGEILADDLMIVLDIMISRAADGWRLQWDLHDDACLPCMMDGGDCLDTDADETPDLCQCPTGTCHSSNLVSGCDLSEACRQGVWSTWMTWSCCDNEAATRSRTRSCDNPTPIGDPTFFDCPDSGTEDEACSTAPFCPINGGVNTWSTWGSCSVTCTAGTRTRSRSCDNPTPQHGGASCSDSLTDSSACDDGPCPINGGVGTWSTWESCSITCGATGTKTRSRACDNPIPEHGGASCSGPLTEIWECYDGPCPINGGVGIWSTWGSCSVTCTAGTRTRSRSCDNPTPQHGGASCSDSLTDSSACDDGPCPINGGVGTWSTWGSCSITCGAGGAKTRSRACDNPTPEHGGASCSGPLTESSACDNGPCPINGGVGIWSTWGSCSVTCGATGTKTRSRPCDNPIPEHGGASCSGPLTESSACDNGPCPINGGVGSWSTWGSCSVTCTAGTRTRSRSCDNPTPQHGGISCSDSLTDSSACDDGPCPINGGVGTWSTWGSCSVTCAAGTKTRSRGCDNPTPQHGGASCSDSLTDSSACNGDPCPVADVGDFCALSDAVPCSNENAVCSYSSDLTGRTFCNCKLGYVQVEGEPRQCYKILSEFVDGTCQSCVGNGGVCYDTDNNNQKDGCVCPPTRITASLDCDTLLFGVDCDSSSMTVCYDHNSVAEHLGIFDDLDNGRALLYATGFYEDRNCYFLKESSQYCLTLNYADGHPNCGLRANDQTRLLSYYLEASLQKKVLLQSRSDLYVLAYCSFDKIQRLSSGGVDVLGTKKVGVEGENRRAILEMTLLDADDDDAHDTGIAAGDDLKIEIEMTDDAEVFTDLRAEFCLVSDKFDLRHPNVRIAPILVDACPVDPLQENFASTAADVITSGYFPAPKFGGSDYLFVHCAVRVCSGPEECALPSCGQRRRRRRRSLIHQEPEMFDRLQLFERADMDHQIVSVRIVESNNGRTKDGLRGVESDTAISSPLWLWLPSLIVVSMLIFLLTAASSFYVWRTRNTYTSRV